MQISWQLFRVDGLLGILLNYQQFYKIRQDLYDYINMFVNLDSKVVNVGLRFLQLGCQIAVAYWAVAIDGYQCQQKFIRYITYLSYALIVFNLLIVAFKTEINPGQTTFFIVYFINLALMGVTLYFTIEGYNKYNNCASTKLLYEVFFIETIIALLLGIGIMLINAGWVERYANWPGNIVWAILIFKFGLSNIYAIVVAVVFAEITITSILVHWLSYSSASIFSNNKRMKAQWGLSMILMLAMEILVIIVLATTNKDGDYGQQYLRKLFVVFVGVNIVDLAFWFHGYRKMAIFQ